MPTTRQAAEELDITEQATIALRDQIADDSDLYDRERNLITDAGMAVIRASIEESSDPTGDDLLAEVANAGDAYGRAAQDLDDAIEKRDNAIRKAVAYGHNRTKVAKLAGISRERLYQII